MGYRLIADALNHFIQHLKLWHYKACLIPPFLQVAFDFDRTLNMLTKNIK